MEQPNFDISIGASSKDISVRVNGIDVTPFLTGLVVNCEAGKLTQLTLRTRLLGDSRATVQAALDREQVHLEDAPPSED